MGLTTAFFQSDGTWFVERDPWMTTVRRGVNSSAQFFRKAAGIESAPQAFLGLSLVRLKKKKCLFPVPRPTLNFWPDPNFFFSISKKKKNPPRRFYADFLTDISFNI